MGAMGNIPPGVTAPPAATPMGAPSPAATAPPARPVPTGRGPASGLFMLLAFLSGMGVKPLTESIGKLEKAFGGGTPSHKAGAGIQPGVKPSAMAAPGQSVNPMLAQMLAAKAMQPTGSDALVALLSKALMLNATPTPTAPPPAPMGAPGGSLGRI